MKVSFRETDLDEKISKIAEVLQSESYELFMLLKQLHDSAVLQNIMQGENGTYAYLSFAKEVKSLFLSPVIEGSP